jgi:hypothetical protein
MLGCCAPAASWLYREANNEKNRKLDPQHEHLGVEDGWRESSRRDSSSTSARAVSLPTASRQAREPARMVEWSAVSSNLLAIAPMHPTLVCHVFHSEGRVHAD